MTIDELLELVMQYTLETYGEPALHFSMVFDDGSKLSLPMPKRLLRKAMKEQQQEAEAGKIPGVPEGVPEVLIDYFKETGKRATRDEVAEAMKGRIGASVVSKALWKMRTAGLLSRYRDERGNGFGLQEWVGNVPRPTFVPSANERGFVYFAEAGDAVKIGRAINVPRRIGEINTHSSRQVVLIGMIRGGNNERRIQRLFTHLHLKGEWFRKTPELLAFIEANKIATTAQTDS